MDSFDLSEQRIVQLEQIPSEIRRQIERGDNVEYELDLSLNRLRTIDHIRVFEHVCQLDLSGNQLESVNGIQALRRLQSLDLSRNCIASVDLLALVPTLQILKVAENSLTTIDSLQLLPELRVVDASYNRIAKWPPLVGLSSLETLDLSDNMLGAFSPSVSSTLFPPRLRRLSIARNQVNMLCGIASLGIQLPVLEFFAFDGNPVVHHVALGGGQLEMLLATLFLCVPLSNDGGLTISSRRREEFSTPPNMLNVLKRAILEGREAALEEFLVSGSVVVQDRSEGRRSTILPPPVPVEHSISISRQSQLTGADDDDKSALDKELALSHESKMEIWKRIQEDRNTDFTQSSAPPLPINHAKSSRVSWEHDNSIINRSSTIAPVQNDIRDAALTVSELGPPDPPSPPQPTSALDVYSLSVMKPIDTAMSTALGATMKDLPPQNVRGNEVLVKRVKVLTEQVTTMRKYIKVWIKREKMVRDSSARKLQRWLRRLQREWQLRNRILLAKQHRKKKYHFQHCSSNSLQALQSSTENISAQIIQSHARGLIARERMIYFKRLHRSARRIQLAWRKCLQDRQAVLYGNWKFSRASQWNITRAGRQNIRWYALLHGVLRCARDVKELQQVCAVQDKVIDYLWNNQMCNDSAGRTNVEKKIARFQRLWREQSMWKQTSKANTSRLNEKGDDSALKAQSNNVINDMKCQLERQSLEIDHLKQQVQALQQLVASLAVTKADSVL